MAARRWACRAAKRVGEALLRALAAASRARDAARAHASHRRYVILPNKLPPQRFEAHLEVHAGSVDERTDEQVRLSARSAQRWHRCYMA